MNQPGQGRDSLWRTDVLDGVARCAPKTSSLLITGDPDHAADLARAIASRAGFWDRVRTCDATRMPPECWDSPDAHDVLLIRNVETLTAQQQAWLMRVVEQGTGDAPRVIAIASPALFMRVQDGAFAENLYYRLNIFQVAVSDVASLQQRAASVARADDPPRSASESRWNLPSGRWSALQAS